MALTIVDASTFGDIESGDAALPWNKAVDAAKSTYENSGGTELTLIKWHGRFSRFQSKPAVIPEGVFFEFLPGRMTCLIKDYAVADPDEPFLHEIGNLSSFGNVHLFAGKAGGTAFLNEKGFCELSGLSISAFDPVGAPWDNGAKLDGTWATGYGNRNCYLSNLRIAGVRGLSLHTINTKAVYGTCNIISFRDRKLSDCDTLFEGPDLGSPTDHIDLAGSFGDVRLNNAVCISLNGSVSGIMADSAYYININSDVLEDPTNGVKTTITGGAAGKIVRPNFETKW